MKWFKLHLNLLEKEIRELSSFSDYEELFSQRDESLVSHGNIVVRYNVARKFPVLIVYPDSYPYSFPIVYILKTTISFEKVRLISESDITKINEIIKSDIMLFNYRHQNDDGSICLAEMENLSDVPEVFSIQDVLPRIRDWLKGTITGVFPEDNNEIELYCHIKKKKDNIYLLLSELFYQSNHSEGIFYFSIYQRPFSEDLFRKKIYIGTNILGENNSCSQINYIVPEFSHNILFVKNINPEKIYAHEKGDVSTIQDYINKGQVIRGVWFHITKEPYPFNTIDELARIIGSGSELGGYKRLISWLKIKDEIADSIKLYIGLRFLNRRNELEWQFFICERNINFRYRNKGDLLVDISMMKQYNVYAIQSEKFTADSYHLRNKGTAAEDKHVKNKNVSIIGCGALGSEISDVFSKAGIGNIFLVDKEEMKAHNAVRHLLSADFVGVPKTFGLTARLIYQNPFISICNKNTHEYYFNVLSCDIRQYMPEHYIGISSIADDNVEGFLNEQALLFLKTIYYVRALRGGKTARIFRVIPGVDACKNCLSLYKQKGDERFIDIPDDENMPTITNECNNPVRPASAADLKLIASLASRIILEDLNKNEQFNHWIWTTETLEKVPYQENIPFSLHRFELPPHSECIYCNQIDPIEILIKKSVYEKMFNLINKDRKVETGGVLLGNSSNKNIIVEMASDSGVASQKTATSFLRDISFCQSFINEKYIEKGLSHSYIGEWHYHPSSSSYPSKTDIESLTAICRQTQYTTAKPIMIILAANGSITCTICPPSELIYTAKFRIIEDNE